MSDDFQVKQSSSSSGAYGLTGTAIGAAAGGFGSYYLTKPKYGSFEELIAEKQDTFDAKMKNADGEEKKFFDAVNDVRNARVKASEEYEAAVKAMTETTTSASADDGTKVLEDAKKKLENKKNALIEAEMKKQGGANIDTKEIQRLKNELKAITDKQKVAIKSINEKLVEIAKEKNELASKYANAKTSAEKKDILNKLNKLDEKIRLLSLNKKLGFSGADTKAREEFVNKMKEVVANLQAKREIESSMPANIDEINKLEFDYNSVKEKLAKYVTAAEQKDAQFNAVYDEIRTAIAKKNKDDLRKAIEKLPPEYQLIINNIKGDKPLISEKQLNKAIEQIDDKAGEKFVERMIKIEEKKSKKQAEELDKVYTSIKETLAKNDKKALEEGFNKLPANQQAKLKEILKNGWILKDFEEAIPQLKELQASDYNKFKQSMESLKTYFEKVTALGGEGAHIVEVEENGKKVNRLVDKDGNLVYKKLKSRNMKTAVDIPTNTEAVTELNNKLTELRKPEQELREQIAKNLKEADYAEELKGVKDAEAAVDEAKKKAANQEKLTLEEATKKVNEKFGVKDKTAYIDAQVKKETDNLTNNFKKQMQHKWGFAEHTGLKVAGVAAAGALILGGLASMMAPKNNA